MKPEAKKEFWIRFLHNLFDPWIKDLELKGTFRKEDQNAILLYTLFWMIFGILVLYRIPIPFHNKFKLMSKKQELEVRHRVACLVYGQIALSLSAVRVVQYVVTQYRCGHIDRCICGAPSTSEELFLLHFASGFYLYDLLTLFSSGLATFSSVLHHVTCQVAICITLARGENANYVVMSVFLMESSNSLRQLKRILVTLGMRNTLFCENVSFLYIYACVIFRFFLAFYMAMLNYSCRSNYIVLRYGGLITMAFWQWNVGGLYQPYHKLQMDVAFRRIVGVKMLWFDPLTRVQKAKLGIDEDGTGDRDLIL